MSNSGRRRAARLRKIYTDESYEAALPGIGRKLKAPHVPSGFKNMLSSEPDPQIYDHGLDSCDELQLKFRSTMALGLFNRGSIGAPPGKWDLSTLTWYTITVSPRWNQLVFITNAPDNVMERIVPKADTRVIGIPGMRLLRSHGRTYMARHVPTGAEIVTTSRSDGASRGVHYPPSARSLPMSDVPMNREEERLVSDLPSMARNARRLLAGLVTRMSTADPRRRWATGNWYWDPLERPESESRRVEWPERRLWGSGYEWEMEWTGFPYPIDVALSLTDPAIGLRGSRLRENRRSYEVILGSSVLRIKK
ncbi:hypothetical protein [Streptomyces sp. NPDC088180]|uniref:hypothetical protein n=1 Tax=Streptomyces sp. NPDC088180 TaxID=3365837 RepID=UPI00380A0E75